MVGYHPANFHKNLCGEKKNLRVLKNHLCLDHIKIGYQIFDLIFISFYKSDVVSNERKEVEKATCQI